MAITAAMVKELREMTGAGMMDCKKALAECDGDMQKAVDALRQKGLSKAAKKSGRATSEGLVRIARSDDAVAMSALQCETDFVSRGEQFIALADKIVDTVLKTNPADEEALKASVGDEITQLIASVGENMTLGQFVRVPVEAGSYIGQYIHSNNKIGVLVTIKCEKAESTASAEVAELAKNIAMQVAATNPMALNEKALDPAVIERERAVYIEKAKAEGKPDNIVERIADGAVKKYCKEVCLIDQPYIRDDKKSIADVVREAGKACGDNLTVAAFNRIQLG